MNKSNQDLKKKKNYIFFCYIKKNRLQFIQEILFQVLQISVFFRSFFSPMHVLKADSLTVGSVRDFINVWCDLGLLFKGRGSDHS